MRLVVLGAVGYAVVYFFDRSLGEERRRRVLEAAQAAMHEVVMLSQRLAGTASPPPSAPSPSAPPPPLWQEAQLMHEAAPALAEEPAPVLADTLHDKVTFFRVGEDEADEIPAPVPVAVIAEEVPRSATAATPELAYPSPPPLPPTIIAYDADPEPEPEAEPLPDAGPTPRSTRTLLAAAAVLAVLLGAAALGAWAIWSGGGGTRAGVTVPAAAAQAINLISQPGARRVPVSGSQGRMVLVVTPTGRAVLIVSGLKRAPKGKQYQAWIVTGKIPKSAGLFDGGGTQLVIPLSKRLPRNAIFAITLERTGGMPHPTQPPEFTAKLT